MRCYFNEGFVSHYWVGVGVGVGAGVGAGVGVGVGVGEGLVGAVWRMIMQIVINAGFILIILMLQDPKTPD